MLMLNLQLTDNPECILNALGLPHALAEYWGWAGNSHVNLGFSIFYSGVWVEIISWNGLVESGLDSKGKWKQGRFATDRIQIKSWNMLLVGIWLERILKIWVFNVWCSFASHFWTDYRYLSWGHECVPSWIRVAREHSGSPIRLA